MENRKWPLLQWKIFSVVSLPYIWNIFLTGWRWELVNKWLFFSRYQEHLEMILCTINSTATPHLFCARKRNLTKHTINDNKKPVGPTPSTRSSFSGTKKSEGCYVCYVGMWGAGCFSLAAEWPSVYILPRNPYFS